MNNPIVSNPNDFKVVDFHNPTDFTFTPEMGCMYDGRPIFGITGAPGINGGEVMTLPYHIGKRLATNLAKIVQLRRAPTVDAAGVPTGIPLWSVEDLETLANSFIKDKYMEEKPTAVSETDRLMAKVEEYRKMVETLMETKAQEVAPAVATPVAEVVAPKTEADVLAVIAPKVFQDKQEVIAELEKRSIAHDKRQTKANLEKLLT